MRSFSNALLLFVVASAVDKKDVFTIDCDSAMVDPAITEQSKVTKDLCTRSCKTACGKATDEDSFEKCLSATDLDGCLFNMTVVHDVDTTNHCMTAPSGDKPPSLVFTTSAKDMQDFGILKDVVSIALVGEFSGSLECTKTVTLGIARTSDLSNEKCTFTGDAVFPVEYVIKDTKYLTMDVTAPFTGAFDPTAKTAVTLFATFDKTCPTVDFSSVDLEFTVQYQDGYRPSSTCSSQQNCIDCKSKGCPWCTWSERKETDQPDWLPEWKLVDWAIEHRKGQCGINTGICEATDGRVNFCDASGATPRLALYMSLFVAAILHS